MSISKKPVCWLVERLSHGYEISAYDSITAATKSFKYNNQDLTYHRKLYAVYLPSPSDKAYHSKLKKVFDVLVQVDHGWWGSHNEHKSSALNVLKSLAVLEAETKAKNNG